jgi:hypothetical protein
VGVPVHCDSGNGTTKPSSFAINLHLPASLWGHRKYPYYFKNLIRHYITIPHTNNARILKVVSKGTNNVGTRLWAELLQFFKPMFLSYQMYGLVLWGFTEDPMGLYMCEITCATHRFKFLQRLIGSVIDLLDSQNFGRQHLKLPLLG